MIELLIAAGIAAAAASAIKRSSSQDTQAARQRRASINHARAEHRRVNQIQRRAEADIASLMNRTLSDYDRLERREKR